MKISGLGFLEQSVLKRIQFSLQHGLRFMVFHSPLVTEAIRTYLKTTSAVPNHLISLKCSVVKLKILIRMSLQFLANQAIDTQSIWVDVQELNLFLTRKFQQKDQKYTSKEQKEKTNTITAITLLAIDLLILPN